MTFAEHRAGRKRVSALLITVLITALAVFAALRWATGEHSRSDARTKESVVQPFKEKCSAVAKSDGANSPANISSDPPSSADPAINVSEPSTTKSYPDGPRDIPVDVKISLAEIPGATGFTVLSSSQFVSGLEFRHVNRPTSTNAVEDGFVLCRSVLDVRTKDEPVAIALILLLSPLAEDGSAIAGSVLCFGAHKVLSRSDLAQTERIVLEQTAPCRDVAILFRTEDAGARCSLFLENINGGSWLSRADALALEPGMWPSEAGQEFRRVKGGREFTEPNGLTMPAHATIGRDSILRIRNLPLGFALPLSLEVSGALPGVPRETLFFTNGGATVVEARWTQRRTFLPKNNQTLVYTRAASEFFPQISLTGPLAKTAADWLKYRVQCCIPERGDETRDGAQVAQAKYLPSMGKWSWSLTGTPDIERLAGSRVYYTLEEVGTARAVVEGRLSPSPAITISVDKPTDPWTLKVTVVDSDAAKLPWPIAVGCSFGAARYGFGVCGWSGEDGEWQFQGFGGAHSERELNEHSSLAVGIDLEVLKKTLGVIYEEKFGRKVVLDVVVHPDDDANDRFTGDFSGKTMTLTWTFRVTVTEVNGSPLPLVGFLNKHGLTNSYRAAAAQAAK
ncbi:MAG: hypothetical protein IT461_00100 [Planctomycetes bacterium]|nr:hypothetical protein [Planctomycetota bacterium]